MAITHVLAFRPGLGLFDPVTFVQQNGTEMTGWNIIGPGGTFVLEEGVTVEEMTGWGINGPGGTFVLEEGVIVEEMTGWGVDNAVVGVFAFESGTVEVEMSGWGINGPA